MQAVVGVLNESLVESLKGFYKMRKAYFTLETIVEAESRYRKRVASSQSDMPSNSNLDSTPAKTESDLGLFKDAEESVGLSSRHENVLIDGVTPPRPSKSPVSSEDDRFQHPINAFVHSGSNVCLGMLLLMLSMIPPVFARLLSIIGFQGDRGRGLRMLWQATEYENINSTMAALILLAYYNISISLYDILPDTEEGGNGNEHQTAYPAARLEVLLSEMRQRYPNSSLWIVEEARMLARKRDLTAGLELLSRKKVSPLKQVTAVAQFEESLQLLYAHRYESCVASFERCCELSDWSHALYLYIAGCAAVQLTRNSAAVEDFEKANQHEKSAIRLFTKAQSNAGKRKFFARQLPLESYVARKISKWTARAQASNISIVEAIGIAPCEEMIYHFGGFKLMDRAQIQISFDNLSDSRRVIEERKWEGDATDEFATGDLLEAAALRAASKHEEAISLLRSGVLCKDAALFKDNCAENWLLPVANYELATNLWVSRPKRSEPRESIDAVELAVVRQAQTHLEQAAKWRDYDLEARMGMRITMAQTTVKAWLAEYGS